MNVNATLAKFSGVAAAFIGPQLIEGFVLGLLEDITSDKVTEYIRLNKPFVKAEDVKRFKPFISQMKHIAEYSNAEVALEKLSIERSDLSEAILAEPGGVAWLQRQLDSLFNELVSLGGDNAKVRWILRSGPPIRAK